MRFDTTTEEGRSLKMLLAVDSLCGRSPSGPAFAASPSSQSSLSRPSGLQSGVGFTPGPWEVERSVMGCRSITRGEDLIASVEDAPRNANAYLIAAAPELYEALVKARDWCMKMPLSAIRMEAVECIDTALAKARGAS